MPNFHVVISEVVMHEILIEADSAEDAENKALEILAEYPNPETVAKDYFATSMGMTVDPFTEVVTRDNL